MTISTQKPKFIGFKDPDQIRTKPVTNNVILKQVNSFKYSGKCFYTQINFGLIINCIILFNYSGHYKQCF